MSAPVSSLASCHPSRLQPAIRAAVEVACGHGVVPDRCDILQDGNTLVLRLSGSLVARVIAGEDGPRQGMDWFHREIGVARFLAEQGAPVIPVHPQLPPGPYLHLGRALNFWQYVQRVEEDAPLEEIGRTLACCHQVLRSYEGELQPLAILEESLGVLRWDETRSFFGMETIGLLEERLRASLEGLRGYPMQALHGDAHPGNLMNTTGGVLWTDWEDTFLGPVEWDLASVIWNTLLLEDDRTSADVVMESYRKAGGTIDCDALGISLMARAAVMTAWYPILYPDPSPERLEKVRRRLDYLRNA